MKENEKCQLILGDCFEQLEGIKDNSIDLLLTDPPPQGEGVTKRERKG